MNAALFMLTSAWVAGADPAPAAAAPAPAVITTGSACNGGNCGGGCATACDDGCGKPGLFSRLKAKFGSKSCGCEAAPACAPAPVCKEKCKPEPIVHCKEACKAEPVCKPAKVETCGGCGSACDKPGLFTRLKGKFGGKHGSACDTCDSGCATATTVAPAAPAVPVAPVPAPKKEMPKDLPKGGTVSIPVEPIVTPVIAPRPVIEVSGPNNPF